MINTKKQDDSGPHPLTHHLFRAAMGRIFPHIYQTPCRVSKDLSREVGAEVFLKLENQQITGSFKLRGVANKVLSLGRESQQRALIAASTGNHGAAFAHMLNQAGLEGKLFVPETITGIKLENLKALGIPLEMVGRDCVATELFAREQAARGNHILVAPYNDESVILGQGTIGVELLNQMEHIDDVLVPVGGGGLISGIAAYLKQVSPQTRIIGCQPEASPVMARSVEAGRILELDASPTLSDGTAGGIEPDSITFALCQRYVDAFILLSEQEIMASISDMFLRENLILEGAAALQVAALRKCASRFKGRRVALILSGSKLDPNILQQLGGID